MILPNAEHGVIEPAKLTDYCLSPIHPVGRHKAAVFRSALGLTSADAPLLTDLLLRGAQEHPAVLGRADEYGQRYQIDIPIATRHGETVLRTAWIIRSGEDVPRLVTCYVL
jgi:hypothetical protein